MLETQRRRRASILKPMGFFTRALKFLALFVAFGIASWLAIKLQGHGLWNGLAPAIAANNGPGTHTPANYDLTQLKVVNEVLKNVRDKYVDPKRVKPKDMRLPGSVAEIQGSPAGPKIGAFFDLDGTLVAGFTGVIMTRDRLRRGQMGVGEFIGMVQAGLNHQLGRSEFEDLIGKGARMLRGSSLGDIDELAERLFVQKIIGRIYPEMRDLVRAHMERGHTVVLSSSALTVQVEPVARFLGIKNVLSNKFETDEDGLITGEVVRPVLWGPGKANAAQHFAAVVARPIRPLFRQ